MSVPTATTASNEQPLLSELAAGSAPAAQRPPAQAASGQATAASDAGQASTPAPSAAQPSAAATAPRTLTEKFGAMTVFEAKASYRHTKAAIRSLLFPAQEKRMVGVLDIGPVEIAQWLTVLLGIIVTALQDPRDLHGTSTYTYVLTICDMTLTIAGLLLSATFVLFYADASTSGRRLAQTFDIVILLCNAALDILYFQRIFRLNVSLLPFRSYHLLRPLYITTAFPAVRVFVQALYRSLAKAKNVVLLYIFFLMWFGVAGVYEFGGLLRTRCVNDLFYSNTSTAMGRIASRYNLTINDFVCHSPVMQNFGELFHDDPDFSNVTWLERLSFERTVSCSVAQTCAGAGDSGASGFTCPYGYSCRPVQNMFFGYIGFDNIGQAALSLFVCLTFQVWYYGAFWLIDAGDIGASWYFAILIVVGGFLIANVTVVVLTVEFEKAIDEEKGNLIDIFDDDDERTEKGSRTRNLMQATVKLLNNVATPGKPTTAAAGKHDGDSATGSPHDGAGQPSTPTTHAPPAEALAATAAESSSTAVAASNSPRQKGKSKKNKRSKGYEKDHAAPEASATAAVDEPAGGVSPSSSAVDFSRWSDWKLWEDQNENAAAGDERPTSPTPADGTEPSRSRGERSRRGDADDDDDHEMGDVSEPPRSDGESISPPGARRKRRSTAIGLIVDASPEAEAADQTNRLLAAGGNDSLSFPEIAVTAPSPLRGGSSGGKPTDSNDSNRKAGGGRKTQSPKPQTTAVVDMKGATATGAPAPAGPPAGCNRAFLNRIIYHRVIRTPLYNILNTGFILANFGVLCYDHWGMDPSIKDTFDTLNIVFTAFFSFDCLLRFISSLTIRDYFTRPFNVFDLVIALVSWIDIAVTSVDLPFIRGLRVLRVLKLMKHFTSLYEWIMLIVSAVKTSPVLIAMLFVLQSTFAVSAMFFLGGQMCVTELDSPHLLFTPLSTLNYSRILARNSSVAPAHVNRTNLTKANETTTGTVTTTTTVTSTRTATTTPTSTPTSTSTITVTTGVPLSPPNTTKSPAPSAPNVFPVAPPLGYSDECSVPEANFDSIGNALVTTFQIITADDWDVITYHAMVAKGPFIALVFVAFIFLAHFLFLNLFVAILLNANKYADEDFEGQEDADEAKLRALEAQQEAEEMLRLERDWANLIYRDQTGGGTAPQLLDVKGDGGSSDSSETASVMSDTSDTGKAGHGKLQANETRRDGKVVKKTLVTRIVERVVFYYGSSHRAARQVVSHTATQVVMALVIVVGSICMSLENPFAAPDTPRAVALQRIDVVVTIIYVVEIVLNIHAYGFIRSRTSFIQRDRWNSFDMALVIVSLVGILVDEVSSNSAIRTLKVLRAARPLRLVKRSAGMRLVLSCLLSAIPQLANCMVVTVIATVVFGVIGVNLFGGRMRRCYIGVTLYENFSEAECVTYGGSFMNVGPHFDDLANAGVSLFVVATLEGWVSLMRKAMNGRADGASPLYNNVSLSALYFMAYGLFVGVFLGNFFVSVLIESYNHAKRKGTLRKSLFITREQEAWLISVRRIAKLLPISADEYEHADEDNLDLADTLKKRRAQFRTQLRNVVQSQRYDQVSLMITFLNFIAMAIYFYPVNPSIELAVDNLNILFAIVFAFDAALKIVALSWTRFIRSDWNKMDFFIAVVSLLSVGLQSFFNPRALSLVRSMRVFRIARLAVRFPAVYEMVRMLGRAAFSLPSVMALIVVLLFIFCVAGMKLFGRVEWGVYGDTAGIDTHFNFASVGSGLWLLARITLGGDWSVIMQDCQESAPFCDDNLGGCGFAIASPLYFVVVVAFNTFIIRSLITAVILDSFSSSGEERALSKEHAEKFYKLFQQYDPTQTLSLNPYDTLPLIRNLPVASVFSFAAAVNRSSRLSRELGFLTSLKLINTADRIPIAVFVDALLRTAYPVEMPESGSLVDALSAESRFFSKINTELLTAVKKTTDTFAAHSRDLARNVVLVSKDLAKTLQTGAAVLTGAAQDELSHSSGSRRNSFRDDGSNAGNDNPDMRAAFEAEQAALQAEWKKMSIYILINTVIRRRKEHIKEQLIMHEMIARRKFAAVGIRNASRALKEASSKQAAGDVLGVLISPLHNMSAESEGQERARPIAVGASSSAVGGGTSTAAAPGGYVPLSIASVPSFVRGATTHSSALEPLEGGSSIQLNNINTWVVATDEPPSAIPRVSTSLAAAGVGGGSASSSVKLATTAAPDPPASVPTRSVAARGPLSVKDLFDFRHVTVPLQEAAAVAEATRAVRTQGVTSAANANPSGVPPLQSSMRRLRMSLNDLMLSLCVLVQQCSHGPAPRLPSEPGRARSIDGDAAMSPIAAPMLSRAQLDPFRKDAPPTNDRGGVAPPYASVSKPPHDLDAVVQFLSGQADAVNVRPAISEAHVVTDVEFRLRRLTAKSRHPLAVLQVADCGRFVLLVARLMQIGRTLATAAHAFASAARRLDLKTTSVPGELSADGDAGAAIVAVAREFILALTPSLQERFSISKLVSFRNVLTREAAVLQTSAHSQGRLVMANAEKAILAEWSDAVVKDMKAAQERAESDLFLLFCRSFFDRLELVAAVLEWTLTLHPEASTTRVRVNTLMELIDGVLDAAFATNLEDSLARLPFRHDGTAADLVAHVMTIRTMVLQEHGQPVTDASLMLHGAAEGGWETTMTSDSILDSIADTPYAVLHRRMMAFGRSVDPSAALGNADAITNVKLPKLTLYTWHPAVSALLNFVLSGVEPSVAITRPPSASLELVVSAAADLPAVAGADSSSMMSSPSLSSSLLSKRGASVVKIPLSEFYAQVRRNAEKLITLRHQRRTLQASMRSLHVRVGHLPTDICFHPIHGRCKVSHGIRRAYVDRMALLKVSTEAQIDRELNRRDEAVAENVAFARKKGLEAHAVDKLCSILQETGLLDDSDSAFCANNGAARRVNSESVAVAVTQLLDGLTIRDGDSSSSAPAARAGMHDAMRLGCALAGAAYDASVTGMNHMIVALYRSVDAFLESERPREEEVRPTVVDDDVWENDFGSHVGSREGPSRRGASSSSSDGEGGRDDGQSLRGALRTRRIPNATKGTDLPGIFGTIARRIQRTEKALDQFVAEAGRQSRAGQPTAASRRLGATAEDNAHRLQRIGTTLRGMRTGLEWASRLQLMVKKGVAVVVPRFWGKDGDGHGLVPRACVQYSLRLSADLSSIVMTRSTRSSARRSPSRAIGWGANTPIADAATFLSNIAVIDDFCAPTPLRRSGGIMANDDLGSDEMVLPLASLSLIRDRGVVVRGGDFADGSAFTGGRALWLKVRYASSSEATSGTDATPQRVGSTTATKRYRLTATFDLVPVDPSDSDGGEVATSSSATSGSPPRRLTPPPGPRGVPSVERDIVMLLPDALGYESWSLLLSELIAHSSLLPFLTASQFPSLVPAYTLLMEGGDGEDVAVPGAEAAWNDARQDRDGQRRRVTSGIGEDPSGSSRRLPGLDNLPKASPRLQPEEHAASSPSRTMDPFTTSPLTPTPPSTDQAGRVLNELLSGSRAPMPSTTAPAAPRLAPPPSSIAHHHAGSTPLVDQRTLAPSPPPAIGRTRPLPAYTTAAGSVGEHAPLHRPLVLVQALQGGDDGTSHVPVAHVQHGLRFQSPPRQPRRFDDI